MPFLPLLSPDEVFSRSQRSVPWDSHPIRELAVSSQLNHVMIDFVFKGRRELILDKSLFCLQIIALPAPRAGIALITSKQSLLQLCPCPSSAPEPEAAH